MHKEKELIFLPRHWLPRRLKFFYLNTDFELCCVWGGGSIAVPIIALNAPSLGRYFFASPSALASVAPALVAALAVHPATLGISLDALF